MSIASCGVWLRMTEQGSDHWKAESTCGSNARKAVPEIMKPDILEFSCLANMLPWLAN